jgi:hypothetical protein
LKDCVHAWTEITSDPFILDAVNHCHLEFDSLPESNVSNIRPYYTFNETEQTVMDGKIEKCLQFIWRDKLYCFTCLPMGLSNSPKVFTKVMKPVFATLRSQFGHTCFGYIVDSFYTEGMSQGPGYTLNAVKLIINLGFQIHPDKSVT